MPFFTSLTIGTGHEFAMEQSAGDGHYLHLQTKFGENRCTQFRATVVTDTSRPPSALHRQDRLQYTVLLCLARSVTRDGKEPKILGSCSLWVNYPRRARSELGVDTVLTLYSVHTLYVCMFVCMLGL